LGINPAEGNIELPALKLKSPYTPNKTKFIRLLWSKQKIKFKHDDKMLLLNIPASRPTKYATVFEVKGTL